MIQWPLLFNISLLLLSSSIAEAERANVIDYLFVGQDEEKDDGEYANDAPIEQVAVHNHAVDSKH